MAAAAAVALVLVWQGEHGAEPVRAASVPISTTVEPTPTGTPLNEARKPFSPATASPSPTPTPTPTRTATASAPATKAPAASGLRIRIPSIGLDHRMAGQGLSPQGTIDPDPGTVMWFQGFERVRPGKVGTAVIAAHVETSNRPDVFANLTDVDVGDTVQVVENGKTVTYRVTRANAIDKSKVTTDQTVWGANRSRSRLAIITCDDAFGFRGDGHRVANYVVIAERA